MRRDRESITHEYAGSAEPDDCMFREHMEAPDWSPR